MASHMALGMPRTIQDQWDRNTLHQEFDGDVANNSIG